MPYYRNSSHFFWKSQSPLIFLLFLQRQNKIFVAFFLNTKIFNSMNEQVAIFIEKQKQKQREEYNRKKNEHLLQLGLVDEKSAQYYRQC